MGAAFFSIVSIALLSAFVDGIARHPNREVAIHRDIGDSLNVDGNYGTYTYAAPSSLYSGTTEAFSSYQNQTYIYTYPQPLSYTSKITITQCGTTTASIYSTTTGYGPYSSSSGASATAIYTGPSNQFQPPYPLATQCSSG